MRTSGLLVAALAAALARARPATDVLRRAAADDACARASSDGQAVELLQRSVSEMKAAGVGPRLGSRGTNTAKAVLAARLGSKQAPDGTFDCGAHPRFCEAPFNCGGTDASDRARAVAPGATGDGPLFEAWCSAPQYEDYVSRCVVDGDLVGAGRVYTGQAEEGVFGPGVNVADASYCFIEGFCLNTAVTNDTTVEEATEMCDERFGGQWRAAENLADTHAVIAASPDATTTGFTGQDQTRPFVLAACLMGNYHCDVMMCRATHCQDQEMVDRFGHFLADLGWDQNTEPWFVGTQ